jgi:hypothetical protein
MILDSSNPPADGCSGCTGSVGFTGQSGCTGPIGCTGCLCLGSPNQEFGGVGIGIGGQMCGWGPNFKKLGNVLVVSSSPTQLLVQPSGANLAFTWVNPVTVETIEFLNVSTSGTTITLYDDTDTILGPSIQVPNRGTNSYQQVKVFVAGVTKMIVHLTGCAALNKICYCDHACAPIEPCDQYVTYRLKTDNTFSLPVTWKPNPNNAGANDCIQTPPYYWDNGADGSFFIEFINPVYLNGSIVQITAVLKEGINCSIIAAESKEGQTCVQGVISEDGQSALIGDGVSPAISHIEFLVRCCDQN